MNTGNEPEVSKAIALLYSAIVVLLSAMGISFMFAAFFTFMGLAGIIASVVVAAIEVIMVLLLRSLYKTSYLNCEELLIKVSNLIGGNKSIPLKTIDSVESTFYPLWHQIVWRQLSWRYYKVPTLGRTFQAITNFHDGLLIQSKRGNYIITPEDRLAFKKAIEIKMKD